MKRKYTDEERALRRKEAFKRSREKYKAIHGEFRSTLTNQRTQQKATFNRFRWTDQEDANVMVDMPLEEIAYLLGRTYSAVCQRRAKLKKEK